MIRRTLPTVRFSVDVSSRATRRLLTTAGVLLGVAACAATPSVVVSEGGTPRAVALPALLAARPLADDQNIRADLLGQSPALSTHLVQVRQREAPHLHAQHDLTVTLLRGRGTLHAAGRVLPMRAGDVAVVPRATVHFFVNEGTTPAVAFVTFAPPHDGTDQVPAP
jgi:mannose-6-phosphate isomerase-like protein (cupin superfamily)